jgi:pectinesterase
MRKIAFLLAMFSTCVLPVPDFLLQGSRLVVTAKNELEMARPNETIELTAKGVSGHVPSSDWQKIHVTERTSGRELVSQSIDMNGDGVSDVFLFQADFNARESKSFVLKIGEKRIPSREQFKAYGRFVRERYDDFAWENDRVAHRMYGTALETWEAEPLTSSAVDVWCKRVRRLVLNDWYMVDNYHSDAGEGGDFYSAGKSRGCGGNGIWESNQLFVSRNFINSRVIANGPVRVVFELTYAPWDVRGREVSEVKRVTLDAGQNMSRFESFYKTVPGVPMTSGIGIKKSEGSTMQSSRRDGWLRTWEPLQKGNAGNLGCSIVLDPTALLDFTEAAGNYLALVGIPAGLPVSYYAGSGWDRSGDFPGVSEWEAYIRQFAARLRSPLKISISPE